LKLCEKEHCNLILPDDPPDDRSWSFVGVLNLKLTIEEDLALHFSSKELRQRYQSLCMPKTKTKNPHHHQVSTTLTPTTNHKPQTKRVPKRIWLACGIGQRPVFVGQDGSVILSSSFTSSLLIALKESLGAPNHLFTRCSLSFLDENPPSALVQIKGFASELLFLREGHGPTPSYRGPPCSSFLSALHPHHQAPFRSAHFYKSISTDPSFPQADQPSQLLPKLVPLLSLLLSSFP